MVFTPSSIGYYLHYSVIVHFIERKSIIHCINIDGCFQASMKWGGQGKGGWGEQLYKFQWMPHYQALGSKEKKSLKHTCIKIAYWLYCFLYVWALSHRADIAVQTNPKDQRAHIHIQLTCECLTYSSRILQKCFIFALRFLSNALSALGIDMEFMPDKTEKMYWTFFPPQTTS